MVRNTPQQQPQQQQIQAGSLLLLGCSTSPARSAFSSISSAVQRSTGRPIPDWMK
jgi:hypothetical protein